MLTLINTNRMQPPIAPVGLDYVASAVRQAGHEVEVLDLCLADDPPAALSAHFARHRPELVGLSLRNVDDCFWPSGEWFVPEVARTIAAIRAMTGSPTVLGGVGFSIFARELVVRTGADFGVRGDGEQALVQLLAELRGERRFDRVEGLIWREGGAVQVNRPAWPQAPAVSTRRDAIDNFTYFCRGGQIGIETKRGCPRRCAYCADPLAKGAASRLRDPAEVADETAALYAQGADVLHLCDAEFNLPPEHAKAVCQALLRRKLDRHVRWYAYLAVVPFDAELAGLMARAGCVGINFTSDAASPTMLAAYRQPHRCEDLAAAVGLCRRNGMAVMLDLLLGGPGETPHTLAESIGFFKTLDADCFGAALGVRIYPGTHMAEVVAAEGPMETNPAVRRRYAGPIDLLQPTFYISSRLGERPAQMVRDAIGGDRRFFPPEDETPTQHERRPEHSAAAGDHNYNRNRALCEAIAAGARGAYWDILRRLRA